MPRGRKPISDTLKREAIELYESGMPVNDIAVKVALSKATLYKVFKQEGVSGRLSKAEASKTSKRLSEDEKVQLVEMYADGRPVKEIAETLDISDMTVMRHVKNAGIRRNADREQVQKALEMYRTGHYTIQQILDTTGISVTPLYYTRKQNK